MLDLRVCIVPGCAKDLDLVLGTNSTVNSIVPLGLLVKMRVHGISRVMKNECAKQIKSGAFAIKNGPFAIKNGAFSSVKSGA